MTPVRLVDYPNTVTAGLPLRLRYTLTDGPLSYTLSLTAIELRISINYTGF